VTEEYVSRLAPECGFPHSAERQLAVVHDTMKQVDQLLLLAKSMEVSLRRRRTVLEDFELGLRSRNAVRRRRPDMLLHAYVY